MTRFKAKLIGFLEGLVECLDISFIILLGLAAICRICTADITVNALSESVTITCPVLLAVVGMAVAIRSYIDSMRRALDHLL